MCQVKEMITLGCYYPLLMGEDFIHPGLDGKRSFKVIGKYTPELAKLYDPGTVFKIPCGHCLGCKLDYSRSWADRMILELAGYDGKGLFCTLTYNPEHVPDDFMLSKRDLQLFFKRLRKRWPDRTLRYYASGEYGTKPRNGLRRRPHYHAIIFGLSLDDFPDRRKVGCNELGQDYYTSEEFSKSWSEKDGPIGFICLSSVSYKTCAYVARYCAKKAFRPAEGVTAENIDTYVPEFALMSRRPGLGSTYVEKHPDVLEFSKIHVSDDSGSVTVSLPSYFFRKFKLTDPERYDMVISERKAFSLDRDLLKLQSTDLSWIELMDNGYNELLNKTQILFNREEDF